ncbi:unnamed protein product [Cochlearia groenlandica]
MAYWLHHPHFYSEVVSTQPQSYVSHAPPPPPIQELDQPPLDRKAGNFMSFSRLRDSLLTSEDPGLTSRKRSRAAQMHNLSERRRREKINKNMKDLKEIIPRCNKTDKASMLEEAIQYIKSLEMQIQMMMSMGGGGMMSIMYREDMQRFMPHMAMSINRGPPFTPFPRPAHISPPRYPFPNFQAFDPASNQPRFPGYLNPYSQFVGSQQMQPPPPMQNQTTLQMSLSQASSSRKEPEGQVNKPTS